MGYLNNSKLFIDKLRLQLSRLNVDYFKLLAFGNVSVNSCKFLCVSRDISRKFTLFFRS